MRNTRSLTGLLSGKRKVLILSMQCKDFFSRLPAGRRVLSHTLQGRKKTNTIFWEGHIGQPGHPCSNSSSSKNLTKGNSFRYVQRHSSQCSVQYQNSWRQIQCSLWTNINDATATWESTPWPLKRTLSQTRAQKRLWNINSDYLWVLNFMHSL